MIEDLTVFFRCVPWSFLQAVGIVITSTGQIKRREKAVSFPSLLKFLFVSFMLGRQRWMEQVSELKRASQDYNLGRDQNSELQGRKFLFIHETTSGVSQGVSLENTFAATFLLLIAMEYSDQMQSLFGQFSCPWQGKAQKDSKDMATSLVANDPVLMGEKWVREMHFHCEQIIVSPICRN